MCKAVSLPHLTASMAVSNRGKPPLLENGSDGQVSDHEHDHLRQCGLVRLGSRGHLDGSVRLPLQRRLSERVWGADAALAAANKTHMSLQALAVGTPGKPTYAGCAGSESSILLALGLRLLPERRWHAGDGSWRANMPLCDGTARTWTLRCWAVRQQETYATGIVSLPESCQSSSGQQRTLRCTATDPHARTQLMQKCVIAVLSAFRQMKLRTSPCIEDDVEAYPPAASGKTPGKLSPGQAGNRTAHGLGANAAVGAVEAARGLAPADGVHGGRGGLLDPVGRELWATDAVPPPRPVPQQGQHADSAS